MAKNSTSRGITPYLRNVLVLKSTMECSECEAGLMVVTGSQVEDVSVYVKLCFLVYMDERLFSQ